LLSPLLGLVFVGYPIRVVLESDPTPTPVLLTKVSADRWAMQPIRGGPKVHGMIDPEELRWRREDLMREAELYRLRKALRANRRRPAVSRRTSTLAWELMRFVGLLRNFFRTTKNAG
jgi:hypothetical protein